MIAAQLLLACFGMVAGALLVTREMTKLARRARLPPFVIGVTVVALGTSTPELLVACEYILRGRPAVLVGSVVGSTLFNIWVLLGIVAVIRPVTIERRLIRWDVGVLILATILPMLSALDGLFDRADGTMMVAGGLGYAALRLGRSGPPAGANVAGAESRAITAAAMALLGAALLIIGTKLFVPSLDATMSLIHSGLAGLLRQDQLLGLIVVAVATSIPEVIACVVAAARGDVQLAAGGVIGSTTLNMLIVLGAPAAIFDSGVAIPVPTINFDLPVMLAAAVSALALLLGSARDARRHGVFFLVCYFAYLAYMGGAAMQHEAVPLVARFVTWVIVPALMLSGVLAWVQPRTAPERLIAPTRAGG